MTQEEKELLVEDLCGRLPYGVKILYEGWDSDHGCEFNTVEDLIGIDDKFIYTLWRGERDKHSIVEPLSIIDYKPYLRPLSSITDEEERQINESLEEVYNFTFKTEELLENIKEQKTFPSSTIDLMNKFHLDYRGLIPMGLALEAKEGMYIKTYKN